MLAKLRAFASRLATHLTMKYNIYPYLDKRSTGKDGRHSIKIAISYNRKADYIGTDAYATPDEWHLLFSEKVPKHLKDAKDKIQSIENSVRTLLATMVSYDIKVVRLEIARLNKPTITLNALQQPKLATDVFHWFDLKIKELEEEKEAYGTAENYKDSKRFYTKYAGDAPVEFSHFTKGELYRIQKAATAGGKMALGNVYRHARQLRAVFNMALFEKAIDKDVYPFHKRGYIIPQTTKRKKSMTRDNVGLLINFCPVVKEERMALDYFIFSFFGNGMNMKDVAYLRYSDIQGNVLRFIRKKTENTLQIRYSLLFGWFSIKAKLNLSNFSKCFVHFFFVQLFKITQLLNLMCDS